MMVAEPLDDACGVRKGDDRAVANSIQPHLLCQTFFTLPDSDGGVGMSRQKDSPPEIEIGTRPSSTIYTLLTDHYAVHQEAVGAEPAGEAVLTISEGKSTIAVLRGAEGERAHVSTSGEVGPVYSLKGGG